MLIKHKFQRNMQQFSTPYESDKNKKKNKNKNGTGQKFLVTSYSVKEQTINDARDLVDILLKQKKRRNSKSSGTENNSGF